MGEDNLGKAHEEVDEFTVTPAVITSATFS